MGIFKDNAPLYWAANLQAIPLRPNGKAPIPTKWQMWSHQKISEGVMEAWLDEYPDGNIGVVPGPISNICFVDIDISDPELLAKVEAALPYSPWRRVGKKGCVLAYKWCDTKSFKIFEKEGTFQGRDKIGFEFFSNTGQVVMPPSVHPETRQPYISNCNLWDVLDKLQPIDGSTLEKRMRELLRLSGVKPDIKGHSRFSDKVSKGTRDTSMIKFAGTLAYSIRRGEVTLKEAIDILEGWADALVQDIDGDSIQVSKGIARIVEFLVKDVHERKVVLPKGWDAGLDEETRQSLNLEAITADDVSLDYKDILDRFTERLKEIETEGKGQIEQLQAVDKALWQAAKSQSISELEIDCLFTAVQDLVGKNVVKIQSLRKGFKKHQSEGIEGLSHGEIAEQVIDDFPDQEMRFDRDMLWEWAGSYWARKDPQEILSHVIKMYGHLPAAKRASDHNGILKTVNSLVAKPIKTMIGYGINFTNGYLGTDLRLTPHDREYGLTYELPYEYRDDVGPPKKFLEFLSQSFAGDEEMIKLVQEALAVTMFGMAPKFQRCFLFYGVPHSGKSVFMEVMENLFPTTARSAVDPSRWGERFMRAQLDGPLLNLAGELPEKHNIDSQVFKQVVNGEAITAEHKNQPIFQFKPVSAHWFASNHLPRTQDISAAFIRRWLILPFMHSVPENARNINLADDLVLEREAIVAWAVEAIQRVIERGYLIVPAASAAMSEELSAVLNPVRTWFNEKARVTPGEDVLEEAAYMAYQTFSLMKGFRKLDRALFRATMRELAGAGGFVCESKPDGNQIYRGLKILKNQ